MAISMEIDEELLEQAVSAGNHNTHKEAVIRALQEYIRQHDQSKILDILGTVEFDDDYDYKEQRRRE